MDSTISLPIPAPALRKASTRCANSAAISRRCDFTSRWRARIRKPLHSGERPRRLLVWDARPPCLTSHSDSVVGKDFEQVVFAVLLGEGKSRPALLEDIRSNQSLDRAVSHGHVQAGRLVIFVSRQWILAERDESSHNASR